MSMKKILVFMLVVVFVLSLVACGSQPLSTAKAGETKPAEQTKETAKKAYIFGATYMTMNNPFFVAVNEGIKSVAEKNGGKVVALDPQLDQSKQISGIEDLIAQKVDAIFVNPVDWKGIKPALEAAKKAGIPVIDVDAPVFDADLVASTVASDNYNAGVLAAKDLLSKKKGGNIVILDFPTNKPCLERIGGFMDTIKGNADFKVIAQQAASGALEQAMPVMENIIQGNKKIDVVMGANDPMAMGALAALQAAKKDKDVLIYGVDGSPDAKKLVKDGKLTATSAQSPTTIGVMAAEAAYKILKGEKVEVNIKVPVQLIDKENVDKFGTNGWQ